VKLARGEYEFTRAKAEAMGCEPDSYVTSQGLFFLTAGSLKPELGAALGEIAGRHPYAPPMPLSQPDNFSAFCQALLPEIRSCCLRFSLTDSWCIEQGCLFVCALLWQTKGVNIDDLFKDHQHLFDAARRRRKVLPAKAPRITFESWNPIMETRQHYIARAIDSTTDSLHSYCDDRERKAVAVGLQKTPEKRRGLESFYWLAGYQVCNWPAPLIAKAERRTRRAVEQHLVKLASTIRLTLRSPKTNDLTCTEESIRAALKAMPDRFPTLEHLTSGIGEILPEAISNLQG